MPKEILLDDDVFAYILSKSTHDGEKATSILRRELRLPSVTAKAAGLDHENPISNVSSSPTLPCFRRELIASPRFTAANTTERYLLVLSGMHREDPERFSRILSVRGRQRLWFARSEEEIAKSGNTTHPKRIPESDYWAMTNFSNEAKMDALEKVARILGYEDSSEIAALIV